MYFIGEELPTFHTKGAKKGKIKGYVNGVAKKIESNAVIVFKNHKTATTTHEILHALGLYHSFDNKGKFVYKLGQTENIMDYSHWQKFGPLDRIALWKWQWKRLQNKVEKE